MQNVNHLVDLMLDRVKDRLLDFQKKLVNELNLSIVSPEEFKGTKCAPLLSFVPLSILDLGTEVGGINTDVIDEFLSKVIEPFSKQVKTLNSTKMTEAYVWTLPNPQNCGIMLFVIFFVDGEKKLITLDQQQSGKPKIIQMPRQAMEKCFKCDKDIQEDDSIYIFDLLSCSPNCIVFTQEPINFHESEESLSLAVCEGCLEKYASKIQHIVYKYENYANLKYSKSLELHLQEKRKK